MKNILIILCLSLPLMACEKVGNAVLEKAIGEIPESSAVQDAKAQQLFTALVEKNEIKVYQLVELDVHKLLNNNPQVLPEIFEIMPDHVIEPKEVVYRAKTVDLKVGKIFSVTYYYDYPDKPIRFTVIFKGHEGGAKVLGLFVTPDQIQQVTETE
ncbi:MULTISPECIES: hypothetical protein [Acinetobacter]|uniref:hypothetical protein n=1 Tax=Acinetobacter TaxID=469 RepID=UPI00102047C4|nr:MULTISPECIES: hypothetical protein [Acinetobacter]MDM1755968.1 hypothetical protein [Acinetobacter sp. 256-1]MDM1760590.1 hypothetical protein [Acinetobacter sp. 251-1]RYL28437.1 hypothetical protein EWP19_03625 [Acinetobacter piscicola]